MARKKNGQVDDETVIAICYDFDKTLSPKDMQEYTLIPKLGCDVKQFWSESNSYAKEKGMDKILSYMKLICDKCESRQIAITNNDYREMGKSVELFSGVDTWFDRINDFCKNNGIRVEHYIISAGLKEIIEGSTIANKFKRIFASSFIFDAYGKPVWPRQVVNYTSKTQYLFRINKGCTDDLSDESDVNEFVDETKRRIPFSNFIYIGDSDTDIPAMKIVKQGGGCSIGVYNPSLVDIEKTSKLIVQKRIDFFAPADYSKDSLLDDIVHKVIAKIKDADKLSKLNSKQTELIDKIDYMKGFFPYIKEQIEDEFLQIQDAEKFSNGFYRSVKKHLRKAYHDIIDDEGIDVLVTQEERNAKVYFTDRKKAIRKDKKTTSDLGAGLLAESTIVLNE